MQLKRHDQVEWLELPRIESPRFARFRVERALTVDGFGEMLWLRGLRDVIADPWHPSRRTWDHHARTRLLRRLEEAEIFLVHPLGSEPLLPALHKTENGDYIPDDMLSAIARANVEWMLGYAERTRTIWAPPPRSAATPAPAPKRERERSDPPPTALGLMLKSYTGEALANAPYRIYQDGNLVASGELDETGYAEITGIEADKPCDVEIPGHGLHLRMPRR